MVDVLRSCYSVPVRFFRDDPERVDRITWYWVPDDTASMPFAHAFGSQVFARAEELQLPIGEMFAPVAWRGGQPPFAVPLKGLCGTREQWQRGALTSDPVPQLWPNTEIPICCAPPEVMGIGGVALGGDDRVFHVIRDEGGVALGGDVEVKHVIRDEGGVALGGDVEVKHVISDEGGVALGGDVEVKHVIRDEGGVALGGVAFGPIVIEKGGQAVGGLDVVTVSGDPWDVCCPGEDVSPDVLCAWQTFDGDCLDTGFGDLLLTTPTATPSGLADRPPTWGNDPREVNGVMVEFYVGCDPTSGLPYFALVDQSSGDLITIGTAYSAVTCYPLYFQYGTAPLTIGECNWNISFGVCSGSP